MPPLTPCPHYHFRDENLAAYTMLPTPTATEQERMHGYPAGYTQLFPDGSDDTGCSMPRSCSYSLPQSFLWLVAGACTSWW